jgi:ferredoxin-NADP reductase
MAPPRQHTSSSAHAVTLLRTERVAHETYAYAFAKPAGFRFKPGQALELVLHDPTQPALDLRRVFSIVSAPGENELVVVTRRRDSDFKRALATLAVGALAHIEGPFGSLLLHANVSRPAVFIAGGIGITPFVSMLRQAARDDREQVISLLYSNHRPEDSAFLGELTAYAREHSGRFVLRTVYTASSTDPGLPPNLGRINDALISSVIVPPSAPIFYVAGPPGMVAGFRDVLNRMGIPDDDIRSEDFAGY